MTSNTDNNNNDYDYGYIYCISNDASMPNIVNIGLTWMTPEQKIEDINGLPRLWRPPTPYKCEFAKRVLDAENKKNAIYKVLSASRITPKQRFFRVSIEEVRTLFDLMDGEYWNAADAADATDYTDIYDIPENDTQIDSILEKKSKKLAMLEDMLDKKELEIKGIEEKMLECLFQKCEDLEMELENKKTELKEINAVIEERKAALKDLTTTDDTDYADADQIITEYLNK
uniref:Uncharacterized protein n=1 Tax=viral metagenome TaxID=1070528 RepID=A0A6C0KB26_9ZZZZ